MSEPSLSPDLVVELLDEIETLHNGLRLEMERVGNAGKAVEDSMDTRQTVKSKLDTFSSRGVLEPLEKNIKKLSMVDLNRKVGVYPTSY